jgi:hypothetical protein
MNITDWLEITMNIRHKVSISLDRTNNHKCETYDEITAHGCILRRRTL